MQAPENNARAIVRFAGMNSLEACTLPGSPIRGFSTILVCSVSARTLARAFRREPADWST
jgi:hypothetical protein